MIMATIPLDTSDAAEIAELLGCLRDRIDLEQDQLHPLLTRTDDEPAY
jgi:hypothetical protein